jgi:hypothetical protein
MFHRDSRSDSAIDVRFIRLLFRSPVEELIAYQWAKRLANLLGHRVMQLRPNTSLTEILSWAAAAGIDSMDFVVVFEPELGMELAEFLDYSDHATFREMVERCSQVGAILLTRHHTGRKASQ